MNTRMCSLLAVLLMVLCLSGGLPAHAQPSYSIDHQGPTALAPYVGGPGVVTDGDILTPIGPGTVAPPAVAIPSGAGGLGLTTNTAWGNVEVDALSYGNEPLLDLATAQGLPYIHTWQFSVDEFAYGLPGVLNPSVTTQGAGGGLNEASADIYQTLLTPGPLAPLAGINTGVYDGNGGATPFAAQGLNLVEPNPPTFSTLPDVGDNLDAWDGDSGIGYPVYFSLDASFLEPYEQFGIAAPNTGTAIGHGFVGGDVLVTAALGGPPVLYADSRQLGLDGGVYNAAIPPVEVDDLDALVLWDSGDGIYQPTIGPYSWLNGTDMLLYSVRRGSAVIGQLDALGSGLMIEEGDILVPVYLGAGTWGPGIFVPGDNLGLATLRSGALTYQTGHGDDLNALDVLQAPVPEPSSLVLCVLGVAGVGGVAWRRNRLAKNAS